MEEFRKHGGYVNVPVQECWDETGKEPIAVRWIDIKLTKEMRVVLSTDLVSSTRDQNG